MNASARPILTANGLVLITNGMGKLFAVRPDGTADITESNIAWSLSKSVARKSSLISVDGLVYMADDKGIMSCIDPVTGEYIWQQRVGGTFAASPVYADGKIYFFSGEGSIHVIQPGRNFNSLAVSQLGDGFNASPAISGNRMILRSLSHLYCVSNN